MEKFSHAYRYTLFKIEIHRTGNSQKQSIQNFSYFSSLWKKFGEQNRSKQSLRS